MDVQRRVSENSVNASARFLRGTSQIFTGGADGLHHSHGSGGETLPSAPTEDTPLVAAEQLPSRPSIVRQLSSVEARANPTSGGIQERLQQEATELFTRNTKWIVMCAVAVLALTVTMIVVFVLAIIAAASYFHIECDQPLKYYVLVTFVWSQVPGQIQQCFTDPSWSLTNRILLTVVLAVPGWCILGWGFYMVSTAKKCPETNPNLFYPTRRLIYVQVVFATLTLIGTIALAFGVRRFMLYVARLAEGPGCARAVHELPKVQAGAKELLAADGTVLACPVCMEPLQDAVRTPCSHFFHEDCLAQWCGNHLDCPLCRQHVGEPDTVKPEEP